MNPVPINGLSDGRHDWSYLATIDGWDIYTTGADYISVGTVGISLVSPEGEHVWVWRGIRGRPTAPVWGNMFWWGQPDRWVQLDKEEMKPFLPVLEVAINLASLTDESFAP